VDTLLVAGGLGTREAERDVRLVRWIERTATRARRVASVCTGAFLLARAGLLDGRRATTHWAMCPLLQRRFPQVRVARDPIFVRDGQVYTSAGITAGIDLALKLVEQDLGRELALTVARWLVMFLRRPGGQSEFSVQLSAQLAERDGLRELQGWIADHPDADLSVPALARRARMSPPNFARLPAHAPRHAGTVPAPFPRRPAARLRVVSRARPQETSMDIAIPLFDGITALDAIGPYEVLSRLPGARVRFVAVTPGPQRTDNKQLTLMADEPLGAVPRPEIVMVPGGFGTWALMTPNPLLDWIRQAHATSQWTTSVCTGSLLLGAAGVLSGLEATTHWMAMDQLAQLGARPTSRRVVEQGKVITAAGVSSGIDMALVLAARIAGEEVAQSIQLGIEYDPQPPFRAGSPHTAPPEIVEKVRQLMRARLEQPVSSVARA